ncbi:hypothetical protein BDZ85DRAFT_254495 [Elsinoe ampelina]|uniref:Uncharacterized protein n=1 Tax=Elsinoe ampelina TaxID=302913 RepID=A0A6A6GQA1_9PEZI|nr:hypothetical protein BDZ85DRAFT_254495 [Elsinoe ampelina]
MRHGVDFRHVRPKVGAGATGSGGLRDMAWRLIAGAAMSAGARWRGGLAGERR